MDFPFFRADDKEVIMVVVKVEAGATRETKELRRAVALNGIGHVRRARRVRGGIAACIAFQAELDYVLQNACVLVRRDRRNARKEGVPYG